MIPPAFTQTTLHAEPYLQLVRFGMVEDTNLSRLIDRLASALPNSLKPKTYTRMSDAQAYHSTLREETSFISVDYVWIPAHETPASGDRFSDVMYHLSSPLHSNQLNDPGNQWTCVHYGAPEPPTNSGTVFSLRRKVRQVPFIGAGGRAKAKFADCVLFMNALQYKPYFQYARKGYAFQSEFCTVLIYKLYKIPPLSLKTSAAAHTIQINLHSDYMIDSCTKTHMIEITSHPPKSGLDVHLVQQDLMVVSQYIEGLGETLVPDQSYLRERIPYLTN